MSVLAAKEAPNFTAPAVLPNNTIVEDFKLSDLRGKPVVLFFWPLDFTFVCPTEIIAHDHRLSEFKNRGVEVVGVSKISVWPVEISILLPSCVICLMHCGTMCDAPCALFWPKDCIWNLIN